MNFLAAFLLTIYDDEEADVGDSTEPTRPEDVVLMMMQAILASPLRGLVSDDMSLAGLTADTALLLKLTEAHLPAVAARLHQLQIKLTIVTPRWFVCMFVTAIPSLDVCAHLWDVILWRGSCGRAVLVWTALCLLASCELPLQAANGYGEAVQVLRQCGANVTSVYDLMVRAPLPLAQCVQEWQQHSTNAAMVSDAEAVETRLLEERLAAVMRCDPDDTADSDG
jgi:Rab-GTPase-TBC domain